MLRDKDPLAWNVRVAAAKVIDNDHTNAKNGNVVQGTMDDEPDFD